MMRYLALCILLLWINCVPCVAGDTTIFGVRVAESAIHTQQENQFRDHPLLAHQGKGIPAVETPHVFEDENFNFLLCLGLLLFIALFKWVSPQYFRNVFRAFRNPTLSARQLKDQLQQNRRSGIFLNFFFCLSLGLFLFQLLHYLGQTNWMTPLTPLGSFAIIVGIVIAIYLLRFLMLKISGWLLHMPEEMDHFSFNLFLINKVFGIALIPFTIILTFGRGDWVQAVLFVSFILIGFLFLYRYLRSGSLLRHFLKFSKFHFFVYLCAAEILPFAVLVKLLSRFVY